MSYGAPLATINDATVHQGPEPINLVFLVPPVQPIAPSCL